MTDNILNDPRHAIFKAYDIRGIYGDLLDESLAELVGAATARYLNAKSLVVSYDMRPSSVPLAEVMIRGILSTGCDVLDVGCVSTDANYFAIANYERDGGIQITASHNPAEYNGFKISREQAIPMSYDVGLGDIAKLALGPQPAPAAERGQLEQKDIMADYKAHVLKFMKEIKPLNVVIDAGNGMGGVMLPPVLADMPIKTTNLYFEPDGTFPNHEANPLKAENLVDLQKAVLEQGADLGVAFDGDADRCMLVDENANIIPCDLLTALMAGYLLDQGGPETIVYDIRSSHVVAEEVTKHGGTAIRDRVGHSYIKATMRKHNALMGGELSGHFYWRDNFFADSGVITMIQALNIITATGKPLSELLKPLQRYSATGEVNFDVEDKESTLERLAGTFKDGKQDWLDGLTVEYDGWWFNVRPSNTEPKLRLNLEADTPELMAEKQAAVEAVIKAC
jgi:phosphomannomutase